MMSWFPGASQGFGVHRPGGAQPLQVTYARKIGEVRLQSILYGFLFELTPNVLIVSACTIPDALMPECGKPGVGPFSGLIHVVKLYCQSVGWRASEQ